MTPTGKPPAIRMTDKSRYLLLENSAVMASVLASMPPMPRPVYKRYTDMLTMPVAWAAKNMPVDITTKQSIIVGLRPMRSARLPRKMEPTAMPISSMESTMPSSARSAPQSVEIPGEAKLMDKISKPSKAFSITQIATAKICAVLIGDSLIMS